MKREIIVTGDNSKTLLIPGLNETYHSVNGATREALHVFIENGLKHFAGTGMIRVFEMGFGTGLNALLALNYSLSAGSGQEGKFTPIYIAYDAIEKYPLTTEEALSLDHPSNTGLNSLGDAFKKMHDCPWNEVALIKPEFALKKIRDDIKTIALPNGHYDVIFYDAFGPRVQPDLWSTGVLRKLYGSLTAGGRLVTYCAQGQFKRNLREAGFTVHRLQGPPGKREMTLAVK